MADCRDLASLRLGAFIVLVLVLETSKKQIEDENEYEEEDDFAEPYPNHDAPQND